MQLASVPVPRIWVEATSHYSDHMSPSPTGSRALSKVSKRTNNYGSHQKRIISFPTICLLSCILLGQAVCQGVGTSTNLAVAASESTHTNTPHHDHELPIRASDFDDDFWGRDRGSQYDPPVKAPGLTDEEFNQTWLGQPNTLKIGVLLPFTPNPRYSYRATLSRISLSVCTLSLNNKVAPLRRFK
jgi:hypothetical protein